MNKIKYLILLILFLALTIPWLLSEQISSQKQPVTDDFYNRGVEFANAEHWDEAADAFKQAILVNANDADAHFQLGYAYRQLKRYPEAVEELKQKNYKVYAIEQVEKSIYLQNFETKKNEAIALVFGNEVYGVEQEVINICDGVIEIPQAGAKHSFNIAVSAGIVGWEVFKQYSF